jgi:hypothetical protein
MHFSRIVTPAQHPVRQSNTCAFLDVFSMGDARAWGPVLVSVSDSIYLNKYMQSFIIQLFIKKNKMLSRLQK